MVNGDFTFAISIDIDPLSFNVAIISIPSSGLI